MIRAIVVGVLAVLGVISNAHADEGCVTLDEAMRICPREGVFNLVQHGTHHVGVGVPDPVSPQIYGMNIEVVDGCGFTLFGVHPHGLACEAGPLEAMASAWAGSYLDADSTGRLRFLGLDRVAIDGVEGFLARYRGDFSDAPVADTWEALFIAEIGGRSFVIAAFEISDRERFEAMVDRIAVVLTLMSPMSERYARVRDGSGLVDFFAGLGCAIGPSTRDAAVAAGFRREDVDALGRKVADDEATVRTGDWLVLSPETCTIRPPALTSAIGLDDPEVAARVSAVDAFAEEGEPGCFLAPNLAGALEATRNLDADSAADAYVRFLGAGIVSGRLSFFSDDPLRTPPGFQVVANRCADIPQVAEIRRNHERLMEHFDALVRANAENVPCEEGASSPGTFFEIAHDLTGGEITNAWIGLEAYVIMLAAGWYEGTTATDPGTPRPPACR